MSNLATQLSHRDTTSSNKTTTAPSDPPTLISKIKTKLSKNSIFKKLELFSIINIKENFLYAKDQEDFYRIFGGHIFFQVLNTAASLDLFNLLEKNGSLTDREIQTRLNLSAQACRILLLPLVSSKILKKSSNRYRNTRLAKKFLTNSGEWKFLNCLKWQHSINYRAMYHFKDSLLANTNLGLKEFSGDEPTLYQRLAHQPHLEKIFQEAMQEISAQCNHFLSRYVDFSKTKYLIDVGGGNGTNIISIAKNYPNLKASVFDYPTVCEIAKKNINDHQMSDRLSAITGSIFENPLPTGADCVIFCHFFTIWSLEENLTLLKKAYAALPKGGRAIIFNMMQNDSENGPMTSAVGSPYFLAIATGRGMLYSWQDYHDIFKAAGFSKIEQQRLPRDHGVIIGIK